VEQKNNQSQLTMGRSGKGGKNPTVEPQGPNREEADSDPEESLEEEVIENPQGKPFSLTPGQAVSTRNMDYTNKEDRIYYDKATAPLTKILYECAPEGFFQYIKTLKTRANELGWDDKNKVLHVLLNKKDTKRISLLRDYGMISLERVREIAEGYMGGNTLGAGRSHGLRVCAS
jgi:hypothetical protein